uniref:Uncharacterized protein n=1 Tax=Oryza glumipatula TaxID=40148 RepID=A0A0E0A9Q8_9ORYZ
MGNWRQRDELPTMVPCIQRQPRRRRARPSSGSSIHEEADSQRREKIVIHVDADNEMVGDEAPPYKEVRREGGRHPLGSTLELTACGLDTAAWCPLPAHSMFDKMSMRARRSEG